MTDLRTAAQQALEALRPFVRGDWTPGLAAQAAAAMDRLEAALAEPVQQGCDHCNSPLYAATRCRVCGRVSSPEPVQEPVAWMHVPYPGSGLRQMVSLIQNREPSLYAATVPLYVALPQRPPLTEEEIREMFFAELRALPSYPSAIEELPERLARAIERAHGIGGQP